MGWLQVKRWLSFLPAAFVVYILLHYLVYQPDLTGPQPPVLVSGGRGSNGSIVSDVAGPRTLQEARVLPHLIPDGDISDAATHLPTSLDAAVAAAAPVAIAVANGQPPSEDNSTLHQGSATTVDTDSRSLTRFDSAPKTLGGVSLREPPPFSSFSSAPAPLPQQEELSFFSNGGGLIGSGDLDTSPQGISESGNPGPQVAMRSSNSIIVEGRQELDTSSSSSSGGLRANIAMPLPLEDTHFAPVASPGDSANLLKASGGSSIYPVPPNDHSTSEETPPKGLVYQHPQVHSIPSHPVPQYSSSSLVDYNQADSRQDVDALMYDQQGLGYPYQAYGERYDVNYSPYQHYKLPEQMKAAIQRSVYNPPMREAGNSHLPPPPPPLLPHSQVNDLIPRYDPYAYPRGRQDLAVAEGYPPLASRGQAGGAAHTSVRVSSTVQSVSSSSSSSSSSGGPADAGGGKASISPVAPAAQNKSPPGNNIVVVQGTGSAPQPKQTVTKKTTVVKKSNVASSSSLSINALKGRTKVGEKYESGFSVPHEELCINNGRDLKVLVLITTAPDHEKHRRAVRQTWGHFSVRRDVVMAFVIGRTTNVNIQNNIDKENEIYGDIIQANFIDHYANLTLKTISMFEWVKTYCSESHFVLKTDDDMFINMPLLLTFIDSKKNDRRVMYGRLAKGWKPVRNKKSKYYIDTATYSKTKYPDFLTGPAYLFTNDIVDDIYQKALGTTFFVLEDVLVTGIVGESLRIKRVGDSRFRNEKIKLTDTCSLMKTVSIHMVKYEEQFDIYKRTLDGKAKCKVG